MQVPAHAAVQQQLKPHRVNSNHQPRNPCNSYHRNISVCLLLYTATPCVCASNSRFDAGQWKRKQAATDAAAVCCCCSTAVQQFGLLGINHPRMPNPISQVCTSAAIWHTAARNAPLQHHILQVQLHWQRTWGLRYDISASVPTTTMLETPCTLTTATGMHVRN